MENDLSAKRDMKERSRTLGYISPGKPAGHPGTLPDGPLTPPDHPGSQPDDLENPPLARQKPPRAFQLSRFHAPGVDASPRFRPENESAGPGNGELKGPEKRPVEMDKSPGAPDNAPACGAGPRVGGRCPQNAGSVRRRGQDGPLHAPLGQHDRREGTVERDGQRDGGGVSRL